MLNDMIKELLAVAEASFKKLDANNDGELDEAEIQAGIELIRA